MQRSLYRNCRAFYKQSGTSSIVYMLYSTYRSKSCTSYLLTWYSWVLYSIAAKETTHSSIRSVGAQLYLYSTTQYRYHYVLHVLSILSVYRVKGQYCSEEQTPYQVLYRKCHSPLFWATTVHFIYLYKLPEECKVPQNSWEVLPVQ